MGNLGISIVDDETGYDGYEAESSGVSPTVIKVVGCGGGGSNAVNRMIFRELSNVDFIVLNTDKQALGRSRAKTNLQLDRRLLKVLVPAVNLKLVNRLQKKIKNLLQMFSVVQIWYSSPPEWVVELELVLLR